MELGPGLNPLLLQYLIDTPGLCAGRPNLQPGDVLQGRAQGSSDRIHVVCQLEEERKIPGEVHNFSTWCKHKKNFDRFSLLAIEYQHSKVYDDVGVVQLSDKLDEINFPQYLLIFLFHGETFKFPE